MTPEDLPDDERPAGETDETDADADGEPATEVGDLVEYEAVQAQDRLWIKAVVPLLQLRPPDAPRNGRVQFAFDRMQVAACERLARILSSDLPAVDG